MKKFTKLFVVAIIATMILALVPVSASAAWDGTSIATGFGGGDGTEANPYLITNENELAFLAKSTNDGESYAGKYIEITADLDLGGKTWTPIGVASSAMFSGNVDGKGFTVSNYVVTQSGNYAGLFGRTSNANLKNINVDTATIISGKYAGGLAGHVIVTAGTGTSTVINCHANNITVKGAQMGALIGRTGTDGSALGDFKIIGCSATNSVIMPPSAEEMSVDLSSTFVGAVIGVAGSTIIEGCWATDNELSCGGPAATSLALIGSIVGCQGASSGVVNVYNCYAVNNTLTLLEGTPETKGYIGGLIGRASHVTDGAIYNCFGANNTIINQTECINCGNLFGAMRNYVFYNNCYQVPVDGISAIGDDPLVMEYPINDIDANALASFDVALLNKGNSTAVWETSILDGHPVINVENAIANEPTFVSFDMEESGDDTTASGGDDTTASGGDDTTKAPDDTTAAPDDTTAAPNDTTKADDSEPTTEGGCSSVIGGGVVILAVLGTAVVFKKRK